MGGSPHDAASPRPDEPPVPGAQWDEVHGRWEQWDEAAGAWRVVGDAGDGVMPGEEQLLPPLLARDVIHAGDLDLRDKPEVIDVRRVPAPAEHVPGAQWNEVAARWERWDDAAGAWVAVES